jgi:hypothetical protein
MVEILYTNIHHFTMIEKLQSGKKTNGPKLIFKPIHNLASYREVYE